MSRRERDLAYSLFGAPLILDVGPTINGEIIRVRVQPINTISVTALIISVLLFLCFMYFYLYPLFRERRVRAAAETARNQDVEQTGSPRTQIDEEKTNLLSWLHFRSRDRFSTAHDSPEAKKHGKPSSVFPLVLKRQPSSFARGSLIPHLSPGTLTPPPPAYASQPNSPLTDFRFPPALDSASPGSPTSTLPSPNLPASAIPGPLSPKPSAVPPVQFNQLGMSRPRRPEAASQAPQGRSRSGILPSAILALRPVMAPRSVSANTVSADTHIPSRARVYVGAGESEGGGDLPVRRVAMPSSGISLAARGRVLTNTRSPPETVRGNVGQPF